MTALEKADLATIKKVRAYERKFGNRREVLEEVARVNHLRLAKRPANAAPAYQPTSYQPTSATSVGTGGGDRMEKSGRP